MLMPRTHLTSHRPSPTTVSYTVSTASHPTTFPSLCIHHAVLLLRLALGLAICTALGVKLSGFELKSEGSQAVFAALGDMVRDRPWSHVGPLGLLGLALVSMRWHKEESLLVLRTLGIQTRTLSTSYLLPSTVRFIPTSQIRDVFIHEAFKGFEVRYYLAVVVEGEEEVVVVFPVSVLISGIGRDMARVSSWHGDTDQLFVGTSEVAARTRHRGTGMEGRKRMLVRAEKLTQHMIIKFVALKIKEGIYRSLRQKNQQNQSGTMRLQPIESSSKATMTPIASASFVYGDCISFADPNIVSPYVAHRSTLES